MFNFVPNISESLAHDIEKAEKLECQTKAWLRDNSEVRFTQSLCLTSNPTKQDSEKFLHSVQVIPKELYKSHSGFYSPVTNLFSVARRCYICDDPFCPNINVIRENSTQQSRETSEREFSCTQRHLVRENVSRDRGDNYGNTVNIENQRSLLHSTPCTKHKSSKKGDKSLTQLKKELFPSRSESKKNRVHRSSYFEKHRSQSCESLQTESSGISVSAGDQHLDSCHFCCDGKYHSHTFEKNLSFSTSQNVNADYSNLNQDNMPSLQNGPRRRIDMQISVDRSSHSSQSGLFAHSEQENHKNICQTFWKPQLSFNQYKFGDKVVDFHLLWPDESSLQKIMSEVCHDTALRRAVLDMSKISLRCGPIRILKSLLALKLITLDQVFEEGSGMLHLALIARNLEAAQFLCQAGISPKLRDKFGHTADQVCFSSKLRKSLPQKYLISSSGQTNKFNKTLITPSPQDKDSIFRLAKSPRHFDELQKKLQTFEFDVNVESDSKGDYLVHIATKGGLCQLPILMSLVHIQGADMEISNGDGMTPLMLAAQNADPVLCDVLLCVFGCNPNKPNPRNGCYALHFACGGPSAESLNCLLNRGADFNLEDFEGRRPDDGNFSNDSEECCEILRSRREQRSEYLSSLVQQGEKFQSEIRYTDLYVVDDQGRTLIMVAAEFNRVDHLRMLLGIEGSPLDAQHQKTGQTALSIAARAGNIEAVHVLLSLDANPNIRDLHGYLPLHYAVMSSHGDVLETILKFFPKTYTGLDLASKLAPNSAIYERIKIAKNKRKEEIVTPELYDCALTGDAERLFRVLEDGDSVNLKRGVAPLYLAVENGHLNVVKLLYEKGGDICRRHPTTTATVLHAAAKMGHGDVVEFLLQICRPPTPPAFSLLATKKNMKTKFMPYRDLSHSYYKELDINALDGDEKTPLQLAADKGYSTIVKTLLDHGATTALLSSQGELIKCPEYDGVRIMIESYREHHTFQVMKCLMDRKGLNNLKQIWLPCFDHNVRDPLGNTPLMVACRNGRMDVIRFLLESAIYTNTPVEEEVVDDSDTDSGLDRTSNQTTSNKKAETGEESSCPDSQSSRYATSVFQLPGKAASFLGARTRPGSVPAGLKYASRDSQNWLTCQPEETLQQNDFLNGKRNLEVGVTSGRASPINFIPSESEMSTPNTKYVMTKLMTELDKPKGLNIYHDNKVCHICAVNLYDGSTALHKAIEGGDNSQLVQMLVHLDPSVAHLQNNMGYSPLHIACKFSRKKVVKFLLTIPYIDIHCRTADGKQPEEICTSKSIRKLFAKARTESPLIEIPKIQESPATSATSSSYGETATTINLDKIGNQYEALKKTLAHGHS